MGKDKLDDSIDEVEGDIYDEILASEGIVPIDHDDVLDDVSVDEGDIPIDHGTGMGGKLEAVTLDLTPPDTTPIHDEEFEGNLNLVESRLLVLWTDNFRTPVELRGEYHRRWPDHKVTTNIILVSLRKLKKKALSFNRKTLRDQLLFEYEILYKEAYQAWLNSKEDMVVITTTIRDKGDDGYEETTSEKRNPQTGDSRHWKNAHEAMKAIREMAGVDEPKRVESIIKREMDMVLQYFEKALSADTFELVMNALVQYDSERDTI